MIEEILTVINKAEPGECTIDCFIYEGNVILTITNCKKEYLHIKLYKHNTHHLYIKSNSGINLDISVEELDYLKIQTAALMCRNRYNSSISAFCENFYK